VLQVVASLTQDLESSKLNLTLDHQHAHTNDKSVSSASSFHRGGTVMKYHMENERYHVGLTKSEINGFLYVAVGRDVVSTK
jgi:hypothetical protein